jgi:GLPGLI family protein
MKTTILTCIFFIAISFAKGQEITQGLFYYTYAFPKPSAASKQANKDRASQFLAEQADVEAALNFLDSFTYQYVLGYKAQKAFWHIDQDWLRASNINLSSSERRYFVDYQNQIWSKKNSEQDTLTSTPLLPIAWQLTDSTRQIGDFTCKQAFAEIEGKQVAAWYTEAIPIPAGPSIYWGLAGLILEVYLENGTAYRFKSYSETIPDGELLTD